MTRIAVILSLVLAAACDVGSVVSNNQGGGPDSGVTGGGDSGGGSGSGSNCTPVASQLPAAHHNAGMTCMTAGCHLIGNTGAGAPEYSFAGTLYRDPQGTNPFPGATISVTVAGTKHTAVTASDGNFYIPKALADPPTAANTGTTNASGCPSTTAMAGALIDNGGNCNNCHRTGGTTSPMFLQ